MTRLESIRRTVNGVEVELVRRTEDPLPEPETPTLSPAAVCGIPVVYITDAAYVPVPRWMVRFKQ